MPKTNQRPPWRQEPPPPDRWLWSGEVAEMLAVHTKTVVRWSNEGRLPYSKTLGGHRRYAESDILALRDRLMGAPHGDL